MHLSPLRLEEPRVHVAPLLDVIFLVLVAFIHASLFLAPRTSLPIELPAASTAERAPDHVTRVAIRDDGTVYLDDRALTLAELERKLVALRTEDPAVVLHVEADRRAAVEPLVAVLDAARRAGIQGLTLAAEQHE